MPRTHVDSRPPLVVPDLLSPAFKANPYEFFARARSEAPLLPVTVHVPDRRTAWLVSRYADASAALKDNRLAKDRRLALGEGERNRPHWVPGFVRPLERNMLDLDPPDHTRLRALVHKAFTPRLVERLADRMRSLCHEFLDRAAARPTFDLVADYALPLPATIIAELLGVPPSDQRRFHRWSASVVAASSPRDFVMALPNIWLFLRYMRRLIARRRQDPRDDLITSLIQAEEAGDTLTTDELLAMVFLLLVAGHETTVNLIAAGTLALLDHPAELARLWAEPGLMKTAVEELLRFTSPVQFATERYAREDLEIAEVRVPRGSLLLVAIASANHDERQFESPEELDIGREPNPHLAFGQGAHYCLGAPLARLEAQIAFETLFQRCPNVRLATPRDAVQFRRGLFLRGLDRLPVAG